MKLNKGQILIFYWLAYNLLSYSNFDLLNVGLCLEIKDETPIE